MTPELLGLTDEQGKRAAARQKGYRDGMNGEDPRPPSECLSEYWVGYRRGREKRQQEEGES